MERFQLPFEVSSAARAHPHWVVVERVAASQCFHASNRLREFLFYVADCALRDSPEEATEQHIGMHVFQRHPGYNASQDSIVRTHARLLRQKLGEYFSTEGLKEELVISIPKGHYLPIFEARLEASPIEPPSLASLYHPAHPSPDIATEAPSQKKRHWWLWWTLPALVALLVFAILRWTSKQGPVERFWAPFLADNSSLVIYSNAVFIGDSTNGLRYAPPNTPTQQPLPSNLVDHYTGIGELAGVYNLTRLFDQYHASFVLKRSLLVTWDQARLSNLIFIGSVAENPSLRVLPSTRDFTIMAGNGFAGIVNHHPLPGEQALYQRPEHPLTTDYAILALLPGLQTGKKMLICSGLTTMGTQAAVEFLCHRDTLEQLLSRISGKNGQVRPFEAVLETTIGGGVPLETHLVTVHLR
jgi:hypothetical protein